ESCPQRILRKGRRMTRTIFIAAASAVALASCASTSDNGSGPKAGPPVDPRNPQVYVYSNAPADCVIVVKPDIISFPSSGQGNAFPIIWHVQTKGYSFAQNNNLASPAPLHGSQAGVISGCR